MKRLNWQVRLGVILVLASAILYIVHYAVFRDVHYLFFYLLHDIAFVPIEVLLVTLIIQQLLREREKRSRLEKLNMVIGAFFSVVGTRLLVYLSDFDPKLQTVRKDLIVRQNWTDREFETVAAGLRKYDYGVDIRRIDLEHLRDLLTANRDFMVRLLENPTLLEHETFTELLRAVFHVTEELENRPEFRTLPGTDFAHLAADVKRAYGRLVSEWLDYMRYLKLNYPYLFSLAMRTNPFDQEASPIVRV
jgi:hypothetical protein